MTPKEIMEFVKKNNIQMIDCRFIDLDRKSVV